MSEWINVNDRLPDYEIDNLSDPVDDVLIFFKRHCTHCYTDTENSYMAVGYIIDGEWKLTEPLSNDVFNKKNHESILVTHWQLLPEPPK